MHVAHAYPIVTRMAESRPEETVVASRYNFQVVMSGQRFVSVSEHPTCMVRGTPKTLRQNLNTDNLNRVSPPTFTRQKWGEAPPSHILSPIWADPLLLPIFSWRAIGCCIFSSFWKTSSRGMVIYQLIRPETGALRGCLRSRRSLSRPRKA